VINLSQLIVDLNEREVASVMGFLDGADDKDPAFVLGQMAGVRAGLTMATTLIRDAMIRAQESDKSHDHDDDIAF